MIDFSDWLDQGEIFSVPQLARLDEALDRVFVYAPYRAAQWLAVDPDSGEIETVSGHSLDSTDADESAVHDTSGMATITMAAGRTGMIDDAFLRGRPIFIPSPQGTSFPWLLAVPARDDGEVVAVLLLAGRGELLFDRQGWDRFALFLERTTGWEFPAAYETDWWCLVTGRHAFAWPRRSRRHN